jgi:hypothetical protein
VYECADGRFVAVGALEPPFWAELVAALGVDVDGDQYDPDTWPAQRAAFTAAFRTRSRDEWAAHFEGTDACVAPVLSLTEAPQHPHLVGRGTFAPDAHGHPVPRTGPRLSDTPALDPGREPVPAPTRRPTCWAHGFTEAEVTDLVASGAVVRPEPAVGWRHEHQRRRHRPRRDRRSRRADHAQRPRAAQRRRPRDVRPVADAVRAFDADPAVRVVALTGAGRGFCSGAPLSADGATQGTLFAGADLVRTLLASRHAGRRLVNGVAAGIGVPMALACDYVLAATRRRSCWPSRGSG